jgi:hypothetical protein
VRTGHAKHQTYEQENASVPQVTPRVWPVWAAGIHIRRGMHFCGVIYARCDCQSGVWKIPAEFSFGGGFMTASFSGCHIANPKTGGCSCPAGFNPAANFAIAVSGCQPCYAYVCYKP